MLDVSTVDGPPAIEAPHTAGYWPFGLLPRLGPRQSRRPRRARKSQEDGPSTAGRRATITALPLPADTGSLHHASRAPPSLAGLRTLRDTAAPGPLSPLTRSLPDGHRLVGDPLELKPYEQAISRRNLHEFTRLTTGIIESHPMHSCEWLPLRLACGFVSFPAGRNAGSTAWPGPLPRMRRGVRCSSWERGRVRPDCSERAGQTACASRGRALGQGHPHQQPDTRPAQPSSTPASSASSTRGWTTPPPPGCWNATAPGHPAQSRPPQTRRGDEAKAPAHGQAADRRGLRRARRTDRRRPRDRHPRRRHKPCSAMSQESVILGRTGSPCLLTGGIPDVP